MFIPQPVFNAGSNAELICSNNFPKSISNHWQWYHNSHLILATNNQYLITNLSREHMGMYQCCYITSTSDSNACCAQTQVRVISKFSLPSFDDSSDKQKMFIITYTFFPISVYYSLSTHVHLVKYLLNKLLSIYIYI